MAAVDPETKRKWAPGIRQTPGGRWQARYYDPTGRLRGKTFVRKTDAQMFLASVKTEMRRGEWADPKLGKTTYGEWARRWMTTHAHLRPTTIHGYESILRSLALPRFGDVQLARIEPIQVREWISGLVGQGLSPSRIRQAYQLLSASMKAAVESGYVARSPCVGVKLPKLTRRDMLFLTPAEIERLASCIVEPYGPMIYFAAYSGLRFGEVTALRVARLDLLAAKVRVVEAYSDVAGTLHLGPPKSGKERTVPLPRSVCELLAPVLNGKSQDSLVFVAPEGGPLRQGNFYHRQYKPAVDAAGLPPTLRFHDLRHTTAALLVAQGAHPRAIMEHLGHSSITVTMDRYGHLFPDEKDRLAKGLDEVLKAARTPDDVASMWPPSGPTVVPMTKREKKVAPDQVN
jgi:integrase